MHASTVNCILKSLMAIALHLSVYCTVLQSNNSVRNFSVMNLVTWTKALTGIHIILLQIDTLPKMNWDTKEDEGKSMISVLYVLQLPKKHILGQSEMKKSNP